MSNLVFEKLTQSLGAGETWRLTIGADFFRIAACAWPVEVTILRGGRIIGDMDGWQAGDYLKGVDFDSVEIKNGPTAQAVTVQIAGGGVGSDRVLGEVSVIDGGKARVLAGQAATASVASGSVAGQYGHVQLWNPAGSGKNAVVEQVAISTVATAYISLRRWNAALSSAYAVQPIAKLMGAAGAPVAQTKYQTNAAIIPAATDTFGGSNVTANQTMLWAFREPLVIPPGWGLVAVSHALAGDVTMTAEFFEEAV